MINCLVKSSSRLCHIRFQVLCIYGTDISCGDVSLGGSSSSSGLLVSSASDSYFFWHDWFESMVGILSVVAFGFVSEIAIIKIMFFKWTYFFTSVSIVDHSCLRTALVSRHHVDFAHPRVLIMKLCQSPLLYVIFVRITIQLRWISWNHRRLKLTAKTEGLLLAPILELWCLLVTVLVSILVDDCMLMLELIRTFLANSKCLVREGSDTHVGRFSLSLSYEFEYSGVDHGREIIKLKLFLIISISE